MAMNLGAPLRGVVCHDLCSRQIISAYIRIGDVAIGYDCIDAAGRTNHSYKDVT